MRINKKKLKFRNLNESKRSGPGSIWTNPPHIHSTTKSICKTLPLPPSLPRHPCPLLLFNSSSFICNTDTMIFTQVSLSLSLSLSSSPVLLPCRAPSDEGQDAVDEQGHDGGAEQASHGHCDKPRQEDVPEEAPVHCFLGADPTHGHDWAHLEAAARREERPQSAAAQKWNVTKLKTLWKAAGCSGFHIYI